MKWREAARSAENGKKRQIPCALLKLPPHLCVEGRRYRTLAVKWAMGTLPPMSNSLLCERSGKFGQEAFKTTQERLSLDALTMQEKEELKQDIDDALYIYQMVKEQEGKD